MTETVKHPAPPPGPPIRYIEEGVRILPPGEAPTLRRRGPNKGENAVKCILGFTLTLLSIGLIFWVGGYNFERGPLSAFNLGAGLVLSIIVGAAFTD